jgi:hypothetical protein
MDIKELWDKIPAQNISTLSKNDIMETLKMNSISDLHLLSSRLKAKLLWVLFFIFLFSIGAFCFSAHPAVVQLFIGAIIAYLLGFVLMGHEYVQLNSLNAYQTSTLEYAKKATAHVRRALLFENIWGVIMLPIFVIGGLAFHSLEDGITWGELLSDRSAVIKATLFVAIVFPIVFWITTKMNKAAFGEFLAKMDRNIREMENLS